jgi:hypothetical protein
MLCDAKPTTLVEKDGHAAAFSHQVGNSFELPRTAWIKLAAGKKYRTSFGVQEGISFPVFL